MKRKKDEKLTKIKSDPNQLRTINYKGVLVWVCRKKTQWTLSAAGR